MQPSIKRALLINLAVNAGFILLVFFTVLGIEYSPLRDARHIDTESRSVVEPDCFSSTSPTFTAAIVETDAIVSITPPHLDPIQGFITHSTIDTGGERVLIGAPGFGQLRRGAYYIDPVDSTPTYKLEFEPSCEVTYVFDGIDEPITEIAKLFPEEPSMSDQLVELNTDYQTWGTMPIGYTRGSGTGIWTFGLYNSTLNSDLEGADCPYTYFVRTLREQYGPLLKTDVSDSLCETPLP